MPTIENPIVRAYNDTSHNNSLYFPDLPIKGDAASVQQYCTQSGVTLVSYTTDTPRYANDGARAYNYWDTVTSEWKNAFGYSPIVIEIIIS
jgi:hypothetical protein